MVKRFFVFATLFIFPAFFLLTLSQPVNAYELVSQNAIDIPSTRFFNENLYIAGQTETIRGVITGDVYCAGQDVTVNADISGDLLCAAQTLHISGKIDGNIRAAAQSIVFDGTVAKQASFLAQDLTISTTGVIGQDLSFAAQNIHMDGLVSRDIYGAGQTLTIAGVVNRDVMLQSRDQITIDGSAIIKGDLTYTSPNLANVTSTSVLGTITHQLPVSKSSTGFDIIANLTALSFQFLLFSIVATAIIGLLLVLLLPRRTTTITDNIMTKPLSSLGWGILIMFITPVFCIFLIFTLIGIPLAILLLLLWIIALFTSRIFVAIAVGKWILSKFAPKTSFTTGTPIWATVIGIVLCWIIFAIPLIGWLLSLIATWLGLGGILRSLHPQEN